MRRPETDTPEYPNEASIFAEEYQSWDWSNEGYYKPREVADLDSPRGMGMRVIKYELTWLGEQSGYETKPMVDNANYGGNMIHNVKFLQDYSGLEVDGVIGPRTMLALLRRRIDNFQKQYNIYGSLLCKQLQLESALYPACRNTTHDQGIAQLHTTEEELAIDKYPLTKKLVSPDGVWLDYYRLGKNVRYLGEHLAYRYEEVPDWRYAVFAWNAPAYAKQWADAGFPASGGGTITVGDWIGDKFTWATMYYNAVDRQTC